MPKRLASNDLRTGAIDRRQRPPAHASTPRLRRRAPSRTSAATPTMTRRCWACSWWPSTSSWTSCRHACLPPALPWGRRASRARRLRVVAPRAPALCALAGAAHVAHVVAGGHPAAQRRARPRHALRGARQAGAPSTLCSARARARQRPHLAHRAQRRTATDHSGSTRILCSPPAAQKQGQPSKRCHLALLPQVMLECMFLEPAAQVLEEVTRPAPSIQLHTMATAAAASALAAAAATTQPVPGTGPQPAPRSTAPGEPPQPLLPGHLDFCNSMRE